MSTEAALDALRPTTSRPTQRLTCLRAPSFLLTVPSLPFTQRLSNLPTRYTILSDVLQPVTSSVKMAAELLARDGIPLDTPTLDFIIHHVFLPPRLPQEDDTNGQHLLAMVQVLRDSVSDFIAAEPCSAPSVQPALDMLDRFLKTNTEPCVSKSNVAHRVMLHSVILDLKDGGECMFLVIAK